MGEDEIMSAIRTKLLDTKSAVTYQWLQKKFLLSPNKTLGYMTQFINQSNADVNAEYIKCVVNSIEKSILISLKPTSEYRVDLSQYEDETNIIDNSTKHYITCEEARYVPKSISNDTVEEETVKKYISNSLEVKKDKQPFFNKNESKTNTNSIKKEKVSILSNNTVQNLQKATNTKIVIKSEEETVKIIISDSSEVKKDKLPFFKKDESKINTNPIKKEKVSTLSNKKVQSKIDLQKVTNAEVVIDNEDQKSDMKTELTNVVKSEPQKIIKMDIKEDHKKKRNKKTNLFENFEHESPEKPKSKRRRLIIESDDEISADDNVLVNDSMIEERNIEMSSEEIKLTEIVVNKKREKPQRISPRKESPKRKVTTTVERKRKILKQVERTFLDEDGFLVTQKVSEEFSGDEDVNLETEEEEDRKKLKKDEEEDIVEKKQQIDDDVKLENKKSANNRKDQVPKVSKRVTKKYVPDAKQTNLMSFFSKKT